MIRTGTLDACKLRSERMKMCKNKQLKIEMFCLISCAKTPQIILTRTDLYYCMGVGFANHL